MMFQFSSRILLAGCVAMVAGCGAIEPIAPVVTPAMAALAKADIGELELGRLIYTTRCTACHNAEPVNRYSRTEWMSILPRMAEVTKLNDSQDRAVRAYVMALVR